MENHTRTKVYWTKTIIEADHEQYTVQRMSELVEQLVRVSTCDSNQYRLPYTYCMSSLSNSIY